jgi:hypothetical protein
MNTSPGATARETMDQRSIRSRSSPDTMHPAVTAATSAAVSDTSVTG